MLIFHENLGMEAEESAKKVRDVYGIRSRIENAEERFPEVFDQVPGIEAYLETDEEKAIRSFPEIKRVPALLLVSKDLYVRPEGKIDFDEDWFFGESDGNLIYTSVARIKTFDGTPSKKIQVPLDVYLLRLHSINIHEVGHEFVQNPKHYKEAWSVNAETGEKIMELGTRCTDPKCIMYEAIDLKTPKPEENYLLLGDEKRFDAGMDEQNARLYKDWFCKPCKKAIKISEKYQKVEV